MNESLLQILWTSLSRFWNEALQVCCHIYWCHHPKQFFLKSSINLLKSTFFLMDITFQFCQYKCNLWCCYFAVRPPCARLPLCAETFSECSIQKKNMDSSRIFRHIKMLILEMITSLLVGFFFCSSRNVDFCQINSPSAACWLLKNVRITQVKWDNPTQPPLEINSTNSIKLNILVHPDLYLQLCRNTGLNWMNRRG